MAFRILMLALAMSLAPSASAITFEVFEEDDNTIVCASQGREYTHCRADTRNGVVLFRQLSASVCLRDRTWGYDRHGIWVEDGCRGEFALGAREANHGWQEAPFPGDRPAHASTTQYCGSDEGRYRRCNVTVRRDVRVLHQQSKAACIEHDSWGWDLNGIWVSKGCRAEFLVY
jgi:hypothetical protein